MREEAALLAEVDRMLDSRCEFVRATARVIHAVSLIDKVVGQAQTLKELQQGIGLAVESLVDVLEGKV